MKSKIVLFIIMMALVLGGSSARSVLSVFACDADAEAGEFGFDCIMPELKKDARIKMAALPEKEKRAAMEGYYKEEVRTKAPEGWSLMTFEEKLNFLSQAHTVAKERNKRMDRKMPLMFEMVVDQSSSVRFGFTKVNSGKMSYHSIGEEILVLQVREVKEGSVAWKKGVRPNALFSPFNDVLVRARGYNKKGMEAWGKKLIRNLQKEKNVKGVILYPDGNRDEVSFPIERMATPSLLAYKSATEKYLPEINETVGVLLKLTSLTKRIRSIKKGELTIYKWEKNEGNIQGKMLSIKNDLDTYLLYKKQVLNRLITLLNKWELAEGSV